MARRNALIVDGPTVVDAGDMAQGFLYAPAVPIGSLARTIVEIERRLALGLTEPEPIFGAPRARREGAAG